MRLEQALEEYKRRKAAGARETERVRRDFERELRKILKDVQKAIEKLENREVPKNIDERLKRIVSAEKGKYVSALKKASSNISTMEELGKRLPDLAKLHVDHGKYLIAVFEKEVYRINSLLKSLSELYSQYTQAIEEKVVEDIEIESLLAEKDRILEEVKRIESEKKEQEKKLRAKEEEIKELPELMELEKLKSEMERLNSKARGIEIEVRSKVAKLQKPVKRMRLPDAMALKLTEDSSIALEEPEEFLRFLQRITPELDKKYRKAAEWLLDNLPKKIAELEGLRKSLEGLEKSRHELEEKVGKRKNELIELKRLIEEKENELKQLRNRLEHLEKELNESLAKLEKILETKIER